MRNNSLLDHLLSIIVFPGTVTLLIPYFLNQYLSEPGIYDDHIILKFIGFGFLGIGLILFLLSIFIFGIKGKGTLAPWSSPSKLVIVGPYKYVRNPMIIGVISILVGEAFLLNSISILIWAMLFFVINTLNFEFIEEPRLERKFGEDYVNYKNKVSRWIPNTKPYNLDHL
jgi:protein-S-isoprenylcysteine O-methyltransferase Ste14